MMAVVVMMMVLHWTGELGRRRIASSSDTYRARHARKGVQIERSAESLESELKTRTFPPAPAHVVRTNPPPPHRREKRFADDSARGLSLTHSRERSRSTVAYIHIVTARNGNGCHPIR